MHYVFHWLVLFLNWNICAPIEICLLNMLHAQLATLVVGMSSSVSQSWCSKIFNMGLSLQRFPKWIIFSTYWFCIGFALDANSLEVGAMCCHAGTPRRMTRDQSSSVLEYLLLYFVKSSTKLIPISEWGLTPLIYCWGGMCECVEQAKVSTSLKLLGYLV